ncbi:MAG TPA: hypothetical protein VJ838_01740 [Gaiellaceae bacterium]|nr:hypothetical protein [Gaiellaceae bacterium]
MGDVALHRRAADLAARVEAFARALQASGVPEDTSMELLSSVSTAVLQALSLELLVERDELAAYLS